MSSIQNLGDYVKRNKRHSIWHRIATFCAAVVVFTTTYALILPAITMSRDEVFCGLEEHTHEDACRVLLCTVPESAPHTHTVECCDPAKRICGDTAHTHMLSCYEENAYICGLQEDHVHGEACYAVRQELTCNQTEQQPHTHTEECVGEQTTLICVLPEAAPHFHSEACYTVAEELVCDISDDPEHIHDDGCYRYDRMLSCGLEETEGHAHGDGCYETEQVYICGLEETEGHTHSDDCYTGIREMVCQIPEPVHHTHTDSCYTFTCGKEAHQHSLACYSDPTADVETEADWTRALPKDQTLTGKWNEDVLAVAITQLGYTESTANYQVKEDNVLKGYTRYGAWYGDPYGDWDAMFVSFCLNYAGVKRELMPIDSDSMHWVLELQSNYRELYFAADAHTPAAGDLVFFDWDEDHIVDHVALISEPVLDESGSLTKLKVIEGDMENCVRCENYEITNPAIIGYAVIPENPDWQEPEAESVEYTRTYTGDGYTVTVTYTEEAEIPEEAEFRAEEVLKDSETYRQRYAEAAAFYGWPESVDYTETFRLFDIGFFMDGEELEPKAEVKVAIVYLPTEEELQKAAQSYQVTHFGEKTESVEATATIEDGAEKIGFSAESFSLYGINPLADGDDNGDNGGGSGDMELLASFDFAGAGENVSLSDTQVINDSTGKAMAVVHGSTASTVTNDNGTALHLAATKTDGSDSGSNLTITDINSGSLLTGYDEIRAVFYLLTTRSDTNWPFYAAPNANSQNGSAENYIGVLANDSVKAECYEAGRDSNKSAAASVSQSVNGNRQLVIADFKKDSVTLTVGGNSQTIMKNEAVSLTEMLGSNSIIQVGMARWETNGAFEYFDGYIADLAIYGKKLSAEPLEDGLIYHASFNGTAENEGDPQMRVETPNTKIISYMDGNEDFGYTTVAPVKDLPSGQTNRSLQLKGNEYIEAARDTEGTYLLKDTAANSVSLDFWIYPTAKEEGDTSNFGIFRLGGQGAKTRFLHAYLPYNNNNPSSLVFGCSNLGTSVSVECNRSLLNQWLNVQVVEDKDGKISVTVLDANGNVIGQELRYSGTPLGALLDSGEIIEFGRGNDNQYFHGYMDEIKIYNTTIEIPTRQIDPPTAADVPNLIAFASFNGTPTSNQEGQLREETGKAKINAYSNGNQAFSNGMDYATYTVAPADCPEDHTNKSLNLHREKSEYFDLTNANAGNNLLKDQGYTKFSVDFWANPLSKDGDSSDYGLFTLGEGSHSLTAHISNTEPTKLVLQVNGGTGQRIELTAGQSLVDRMVNYRVDYDETGNLTVTLKDANNQVIAVTQTVSVQENGSWVAKDQAPSADMTVNALFESGETVRFGTDGSSYFNGVLDEVKIYAENTDPDSGASKDNMIAYATFDSASLKEMTGNAVIEATTSDTRLNYGYTRVIPNHDGYQDTSLSIRKAYNERIQLVSSAENDTLLKDKDYNTFTVDFWAAMDPNSESYGLFDLGSDSESISAYFRPTADDKSELVISLNGQDTVIPVNQNIDKWNWFHVNLDFKNDNTMEVVVKNRADNTIGSASIITGMEYKDLFAGQEKLVFGQDASGRQYDGILDEIKITAYKAMLPDGTHHPQSAVTRGIAAKSVFLYNIDTAAHNSGNPLAGVTYTVYNQNGTVARAYVTGSEYLLNLDGLTPGGTYTIKQTGVPQGSNGRNYVVAEQTKTFTLPSASDAVTEVGVFFDFINGEGYAPEKTAEVYNYADRIYNVDVSALSGAKDISIEAKKFNFIVDQSNSMLFPAKLVDTNKEVTLHYRNDDDSSTDNDAGGNSKRMDTLGLNPDEVYYLIALPEGKATVYALWRSSNGLWYYQDAAYYAQAKMGTTKEDGTVYQFADVGTNNNTIPVESGGCLNGVDRRGDGDSRHGYTITASDWAEDFSTGTKITLSSGDDYEKTYKLYTAAKTGDQIDNRLTYLRYAIKRMLYQLAAMGSQNEVTITTFDKNLEGCMTRAVNLENPAGLNDLIEFVDAINTGGGTSQNFGLWHVTGQNPAQAEYNKSGCTSNHMNGDNTYVIMITDGALNAPENTIQGSSQEDDTILAGAAIRNQNAKLITIGLSVQNVTLAQSLLADINTSNNGIASPGMAFLDRDADALSEQLSNALLGDLVDMQVVDDTATIKDYISDSFYLTAPNLPVGEPLQVGDWVSLDGLKVASDSPEKVGQVKQDGNDWYVEWNKQTLPANVLRDKNGTILEIGDKVTAEGVKDNANGIGTVDLSASGEWVVQGSDDSAVPVAGLQYPTPWHGRLYVKAKEDFIGGNTIDTNKIHKDMNNQVKDYGLTIDLIKTVGEQDIRTGTIANIDTPTVNVRLLPMNQWNSVETVFLGDLIFDGTPTYQKFLDKLDRIKLTKLISGTDDIHNRVSSERPVGINVGDSEFSLYYALGRSLEVDDWTDLLNGETVTIDYTYDDNSSHGRVGTFDLTLTKSGDTSSTATHPAMKTGVDVETYTLTVTYTAEKITGGPRPETKHNEGRFTTYSQANVPNGSGIEVGSNNSGELTTGLGILTSTNIHRVNVLDGKVTVIKTISNELKNDTEDQVFHFKLTVPGEETGSEEAGSEEPGKDLTVTVKAGELSGTATIENLSRGAYTLEEIVPEGYVQKSIAVLIDSEDGDTNCRYSENDPVVTFEMGTYADGCNVISTTNTAGLAGGTTWHYSDAQREESQETENGHVHAYYTPATDDECKNVTYGAAEVENAKAVYKADLPITKTWNQANASVYENLTVYVALYKQNQAQEYDLVLDADGNAQVLKLTKDTKLNDIPWSGKFTVTLPDKDAKVEDQGYSIRELSVVTAGPDGQKAIVVNVPGEDATYVYMDPANAVADSGFITMSGTAYRVTVTENPSIEDKDQPENNRDYSLTLANSEAYKLPESGGMGTTLFTSVGLFLTLGSALGLGKKRGAKDDD